MALDEFDITADTIHEKRASDVLFLTGREESMDNRPVTTPGKIEEAIAAGVRVTVVQDMNTNAVKRVTIGGIPIIDKIPLQRDVQESA